jgi:hypothetical protein
MSQAPQLTRRSVLLGAAGVAAAGDAAPGGRWRGLFVQDYTPEEPVYLDLALASGLWVSSPVPVLGGRLVAQFAARNYGDYPARLAGLALGVRGPAGEDLGGLFGAEPAGAPAAPLGPGQQRATCRTSGAFGTRPGRYQLLAGYLGEDGAWRRLPAGAPGTAGRVGVTAMPPARRERVRVSFERVTVVDAARLGGKLALRLEVNGRELAWPAAGMVAVEDGASLDVGARFEALVDPGGLLELLVEGGSAGGLVAERLTGPSGWGRGSWAWQSRVPPEPAAGQGRVPGPDWAPGPWTIHLSIDTAPL